MHFSWIRRAWENSISADPETTDPNRTLLLIVVRQYWLTSACYNFQEIETAGTMTVNLCCCAYCKPAATTPV
jgi:hypothetical protein